MDAMLRRIFPLATALLVSPLLSANTLTDVGVGAAPDYDPANGTAWTLSSSCVDINDNGEAACQTRADGPVYRCGFRGIKRCGSKVYQVQRWDGAGLVLMSDPAATYDVPLSMNNLGDIAGYSYDGSIYPSGGGNGRIWSLPENPTVKPSVVSWINDQGDYIQKTAVSSGGVVSYSGKIYDADGMEIPYPGDLLYPFVIGNGGEVIGGQVIQSFVSGDVSPTGNEIPDVSGVGWLYTQAELDTFPRDPDGLYDVDGTVYWPLVFYRPNALAGYISEYTTTASDINDHGDFVGRMQFGGLYSGRYCTREGDTVVRDAWGVKHRVPWYCEGTNYSMGTYAGGKAFSGINNIGDAVGVFTPGVYTYQSSYPTYPWVWLRNADWNWDEYDANDLLPPGSGYTVLSVNDINDARQIVGTCRTPAGETRGCIINVDDPPIPADTIKPRLRIDSPANGAVVTGKVPILVSAWDRQSRIKRVVVKVVGAGKGVKDRVRPYAFEWDFTGYAPGDYVIRAVAIDNAGNRRARKITVTVKP